METVCIFSSDDLDEIEMVKNILEENDIPTMVKNLYTQNIFGGVKPFSGHDAIAGSMQIFVREDQLEKGLEILKANSEETGEEVAVLNQEEVSAERVKAEEADLAERRVKRLIYFGTVLSALSFLMIPYLLNIPILIRLLKKRRTIGIMLLLFGTLLAGLGGYFFMRSRIG